MRTVDLREVLTRETPKASATHVSAIVGRTLGDVSVEELMQASHSSKASTTEQDPAVPLREVYVETEEE